MRPVAVLGTLGFSAGALLPSVTTHERVGILVAFSSRHPDGRRASADVARYCAGLGLPFRDVPVPAPHDLIRTALLISREVRRCRQDGADCVMNVTGGRRILAAAAQLVCALDGVPAEQVRDDGRIVALALPRLRLADAISRSQSVLLRALLRAPARTAPVRRLAADLGIRKSVMSYHLHRLLARGLVEVRPDPRDARRRIVVGSPMLALFFAADDAADDLAGAQS